MTPISWIFCVRDDCGYSDDGMINYPWFMVVFALQVGNKMKTIEYNYHHYFHDKLELEHSHNFLVPKLADHKRLVLTCHIVSTTTPSYVPNVKLLYLGPLPGQGE